MKNKQKKQNTLRLIIQCISFAFHNGYINGWVGGKIYPGPNKAYCIPGLNCYSCPGAIGACPIGSLQAVLDDSGFHLSLYVAGFIGAVGVFCGRFICGWLCPFGLVQDLLYRIPFFKKIKNLPGHRYLRYLRFAILAVFVIALPMGVKNQAGVGQPWFCEYICPSGTLLGGIPLVIANESLQKIIGPRFLWKVFLLILILVAAILSDRPFCKYICPLGALYGLANPISIYRLKIDRNTCVECGACQRICGADIKVYETPNSMDCIRCGKCMAACPTGSIYSTFSRRNFVKTTMETVAETSAGTAAETLAEAQAASFIEKPENANAAPAVSRPDTQRNAAVIISGVLCLIISLYVFQQAFTILHFDIMSGEIVDISEFVRYMFDFTIYLAPAAMTLILGVKLLRAGIPVNAALNQNNSGKLRQWAMNTLIVTVGCVVLVFVVYMILSILDFGRISIVTLMFPRDNMEYAFKYAVMLALVNFIAWLLIPGETLIESLRHFKSRFGQ